MEGENAKVTVIAEEQKECKVSELKGNGVLVKLENTLEQVVIFVTISDISKESTSWFRLITSFESTESQIL